VFGSGHEQDSGRFAGIRGAIITTVILRRSLSKLLPRSTYAYRYSKEIKPLEGRVVLIPKLPGNWCAPGTRCICRPGRRKEWLSGQRL